MSKQKIERNPKTEESHYHDFVTGEVERPGNPVSGPPLVMTAEDVKGVEIAENIRAIGMKIVVAHLFEGELYLQLCRYIRDNQVMPKVIRAELSAVGFDKTRISKVVRVSQAPDDIWSEWTARSIGFNKALSLTRENARLLKEGVATRLLTAQGIDPESVDELAGRAEDEARAEAIRKEESRPKDETESLKQRFERAVQALLRVAEEAAEEGLIRSSTKSLGGLVIVKIQVKKGKK